MYRYLAIVWDPHDPKCVRASATIIAKTLIAGWSVAYEGAGIRLLGTGARPTSAVSYPLRHNGGVIFGRLFTGDRVVQPASGGFDDAETRRILSSSGQHVIDHYWGSYIALLYDESARQHHVFRDPTATLACYHTRHAGIDIFFSDIEDCIQCVPGPFAIDRDYVACWLYSRTECNTGSTGVAGFDDVGPGQRLTLRRGDVTRTRIWDPAAIAGEPIFADTEQAANALRSSVQDAVNAWASCYRNITHRLSGGLDSSIVAGCLAQAPSKPSITFLNLSVNDRHDQEPLHLPGMDAALAAKVRAIAGRGDERQFARAVAKRWGVALIERARNPSAAIGRLQQVSLKLSPALYFTMVEMDDAELEMIRSFDTQAFFSGQAGDSVFGATTQAVGAMDYAYLHGVRPGLWRQLLASSAISRTSLWSVLGQTLVHGILRRPYVSLAARAERPSLMPQDLLAALVAEQAQRHSQHLPSVRLPPGKRLHVRGAAASPFYDIVFQSGNFADHVDPLNAQPVWERVLRTPMYSLLLNGTSRGLARHAFRDVLPEEIRKRVTKGTGSPFYQHVVRTHLGLLRDHLLEGLLVKENYLDRRKLERCLCGTEDPSMTIYAPTLLSYLSAEIWLRQWQQAAMNCGLLDTKVDPSALANRLVQGAAT